jgi:hypothetical protein
VQVGLDQAGDHGAAGEIERDGGVGTRRVGPGQRAGVDDRVALDQQRGAVLGCAASAVDQSRVAK